MSPAAVPGTVTPGARYRRWALVFLGATVTAGVWLRAALMWPEALGPFRLGDGIHAHSHLAFFGWLAPAVFALVAAHVADPRLSRRLHHHAGLVALASAAAFGTFLVGGYWPPSMAVAGFHVLLWVAFAALVLPRLASAPARGTGAFWTAALAFLLVAGAGTMAPAAAMVRGVTSAWWNQVAVGLFLVPFLSGFAALAAMGALQRGGGPMGARSRAALWLTAAGVLPGVLAYPAAAPPWPGATLVSRLGLACLGAGLLLFAWDLLSRGPRRWDFRTGAGVAAAVAGVLKLMVAVGVAASLAHRRPIAIAFLHLVLLGFVTPALLHGLGVRGVRTPGRVRLYAAGLTLMLSSLVWSGIGPLMALGRTVGVGHVHLLLAALAGGTAVAGAVLSLLPSALQGPDDPAPQPDSVSRSATRSSARPVVA